MRRLRTFGRYRLLELVASGGMAEVWRAEAPGAEGFVKEVALKLIRGDHDENGDFVRMFIQEARLASRLSHANIVQVFDFDQVDGRYYIAMELVRGRTLREAVDRCRELGLRPGLARAVHVCAEVARALAYAHRFSEDGAPAGLVHRDVSPQNVLLSYEGEVKLTDFGIARALGASEQTAPGTIKGKLAYMAPEQARGEDVDGRADVFALGVMLWELCTGRRLFARESDAATFASVVSTQPISPPSAWNESVPPELDELILKALERDLGRRTASAEELAASLASIRLRLATGHEDLDLRAFMRRLWPDGAASRGQAPPDRTALLEPPAIRAPVAPQDLSTRTAAGPPGRARSWPRALAISALVVAFAGVGGWKAWRGASTPAAAPSANSLAGASEPRASPSSKSGAQPPAPPSGPAAAAPSPAAIPTSSATPTPPAASSATSTPTAPPTSTSTASAPAEPSRPHAGSLPAPQRAGSIAVHATPWAYVTIDGVSVGEAPLEKSLPAGVHRLRARHPQLGSDEILVNLSPGQRYVWRPKLSR
jgi:serine/threonine-protein kinase